MIGSGVDFDSNPITIIFAVGENSTRVNVSVMADNLLEGEESFDIILSLRNDNFEVILGRSRATGRITDSTGKLHTHIDQYTVLKMIVNILQVSMVG